MNQVLRNKERLKWICVFMRYFWILAFGALFSAHAETTLQSGPNRVSLLELYTSEGCSSCPPAESWLEGLKKGSRLWHDVVPVVFHVDYWDNLGWKDRFSKQEYTARQQAYSIAWGTSSVYTPGFVLDGAEWKGWFSGNPLPNADNQPAGKLEVQIGNKTARILFTGMSGLKEIDTYLAPLEMNVSSDVLAGENRGRKLAHSFVALSLNSRRISNENGSFKAEIPFDYPTAAAVAVWVTAPESVRPLQAVGGYVK
jgi:hypothetical protein